MHDTLYGDGSADNPGLEKVILGFLIDNKARREEREIIDKNRARLHYALLGGLITFVVGATLWFMTWMTDFMKTHHISDNKPPITSSMSDPANAAIHPTQP